jgi:hypothetical protein
MSAIASTIQEPQYGSRREKQPAKVKMPLLPGGGRLVVTSRRRPIEPTSLAQKCTAQEEGFASGNVASRATLGLGLKSFRASGNGMISLVSDRLQTAQSIKPVRGKTRCPSMGSGRTQTPLERADGVIARKAAAASARGDFDLHDPWPPRKQRRCMP